ncbi:MAG TPA: flagellar basal body rod protein [Gammaproteobacteria bacterium]|nr:flagellar basal body rod protein [Gammaproteobacteria bacterium]
MATAAPAPASEEAAAPKGKKKLIIIIIAVVLLLVLVGGGAAVFLMKKKAADAAAAEGEGEHAAAVQNKPDPKHPPVFLPLDPFTVNLADREVDRFAQIGITLEVKDAAASDQLKGFMPAIRNNVLMILAHKTSTELLTLEGKEKLAREILRAAVLPLGIELETEGQDPQQSPSNAKKKSSAENPVIRVHFSNFIVQ